jgi:hypothetical protein
VKTTGTAPNALIEIRRDSEIYAIDGGWFQARWHFSFDQYYDPQNMGIGTLRVFNHDTLVPGAVWPMHPHRDIEGITWVVAGTFEHADSAGNGGVLYPGAVQRVTLGSGLMHRRGTTGRPNRCSSSRCGSSPIAVCRRPSSSSSTAPRSLQPVAAILRPEGTEGEGVTATATSHVRCAARPWRARARLAKAGRLRHPIQGAIDLTRTARDRRRREGAVRGHSPSRPRPSQLFMVDTLPDTACNSDPPDAPAPQQFSLRVVAAPRASMSATRCPHEHAGDHDEVAA